MDRDREIWLNARRGMVTASVSSALLGVSPFADALDVYADFVAPKPTSEKDQKLDITHPAFWGKALEQAISGAVANYYHWEIEPGGELLQSKDHPFLGATLDNEINNGTGWGIYEGKTTSIWRSGEWKDDSTPPDFVYVQNQHQLLVTKASYCVTFVLVGGQTPKSFVVEPNPDIHRLLIEFGESFMARVRSMSPPPPTTKSAAALVRLYPGGAYDKSTPVNAETALGMPKEALDWTRDYYEASSLLKMAENQKALALNHIKACLKDKPYGILPEPVDGASMWRWVLEGSRGKVIRPMKGDKNVDSLYPELPSGEAPQPFELSTMKE
jgi:predicted phage-related endonuclease